MNTQDKIKSLLSLTKQLKLANDLRTLSDDVTRRGSDFSLNRLIQIPECKKIMKEYIVRMTALNTAQGSDSPQVDTLTDYEIVQTLPKLEDLLRIILNDNDNFLKQEIAKIILS